MSLRGDRSRFQINANAEWSAGSGGERCSRPLRRRSLRQRGAPERWRDSAMDRPLVATVEELRELGHLQHNVLLQHNILLEGPSGATHAALALLRPHLRAPMVTTRQPAMLDISNETGTLIIEDVDALSGFDQRRMLHWMSGPGAAARVISMATRRLFALVGDGRFDANLYYRLNTMLLLVE